jgi:hypothetical protein
MDMVELHLLIFGYRQASREVAPPMHLDDLLLFIIVQLA